MEEPILIDTHAHLDETDDLPQTLRDARASGAWEVAAVKRTPLEQLLIETDAPVAYQGKEAGPKDVWITLDEVSRAKEVDRSLVARQTTVNASLFFHIPFGGSGPPGS